MKYKKCNSLIQKNIATMDHGDEYRPIGAVGLQMGTVQGVSVVDHPWGS